MLGMKGKWEREDAERKGTSSSFLAKLSLKQPKRRFKK